MSGPPQTSTSIHHRRAWQQRKTSSSKSATKTQFRSKAKLIQSWCRKWRAMLARVTLTRPRTKGHNSLVCPISIRWVMIVPREEAKHSYHSALTMAAQCLRSLAQLDPKPTISARLAANPLNLTKERRLSI